jgi:bromodomain-containing factor 1
MFEAKNADLASPFLYPVEEIVRALPDYTTVVKNPIDLNHIKARINEGEYDDAQQLNSDFRMMCQNAMKFNPPSHDVHIAAQRFLKLWEEKWKALPPKEAPPRARSYSDDPVEDVADAEDDDFEDGELSAYNQSHTAQLTS